MKEQKIKVICGLIGLEEKINNMIGEMKKSGWQVKQIASHASNQTIVIILFEREE